jgi:hypothetical protein
MLLMAIRFNVPRRDAVAAEGMPAIEDAVT